MEIGVQFYTLRDTCKDLAGLDETLKRVADIGYKNVQLILKDIKLTEVE